MKILKISFENIHSLHGKHEINFATGPLAEAGLFAITGPTGSGKSTLLDVITLALFNRIARVDRDISNTILEDDGGIMTRNTTHCLAEVEYRVKGKTYCSHWSIERNRNNNLKSRKQELIDIESGHILMEGTKTPQKNEEVIGLTYDQFVKAMVLAQGEFSKLLKAKREDRNRLLEDITGARSYRNIGIAVYQRYAGILKKIELKKAELTGIEISSEEAVNQQKEELKTLTDERSKIEKEYQIAAENVKIKKDLLQKIKTQDEVNQQLEKLIKDKEVYEPYEQKLITHDRLCVYEDDLRKYDTAQNEYKNLIQQLDLLEKEELNEKENLNDCISKITNLIGSDVNRENAASQLETFKNKIFDLQNSEKIFSNSAQTHKLQVNAYVSQISALGYPLAEAETPETFESHKSQLEKLLQEEIKKAGVNSENQLDDLLKSKRNKETNAAGLLNKKEILATEEEKQKKNHGEQEDNLKKLKQNNGEITEISKEINALAVEIKNLEKKIFQKREHQSLEQYREQLTPDEPCPLCGSTHHPYATHQPVFDVEEELLDQKKEIWQNKTNLVASKKANTEMLHKLNQKIEKDNEDLNEKIIKLKSEIQSLAAELDWSDEETIENLTAKKARLSRHITDLEKFKNAFRAHEILNPLHSAFSKWHTDSTNFRKVNSQRKALYAGDNIAGESQQLSSHLTNCLAQLKALDSQIKTDKEKLETLESTCKMATEKMEEILNAQNIDTVETLRGSILKPDIAQRIRSRKSELETAEARIDEAKNRIENELKDLQAKDNNENTLEELTAIFETINIKRENNLLHMGRLEQSLKANDEALKRHKRGLDVLAVLEKDRAIWEKMNKLIGDSKGNKFSNFVQDLTLEQLIGYTNRRLQDFTDRYLIDIPTTEEAEKSDTLKVFDHYMGNTRRSVNTLSGGETFLLSLAMAFALSDIAARNVKIESLFIDEGFGTLDAETLDQAITILEKIQSEGDKSVGVISHVDALKERITTQIQLEKSNLGYSTVSIVQ